MRFLQTMGKGKDGYALATVLAAVTVCTLLVASVVKVSMQRCYSVNKLGDKAKAITYSEAGLDYAYSILSADFSKRTDGTLFPSSSYGNGSYAITLSDVTSNSVLVTCVGYCGSASNVSAISVRNYTVQSAEEDYDDSSEAWDYAVFTGGGISWNGSGTFDGGGAMLHSSQAFLLSGSGYVNADVYSPEEIELKGNACELDGNATAPSIIDKKNNITGTPTEEEVASITFPEIDLTPYYQEALANGMVYDGDQSWSYGSDYTPEGGIIWVNGSVNLSGSGTLNACIISTGDLKSSLSGGVTQYSTYPALVSRDGSIKISSQGDYVGLIYTKSGDFSMSGGGSITGQIMVAGDMAKSGNSDAISFVNSAPTPPGGSESEDEDVIGISAWEK